MLTFELRHILNTADFPYSIELLFETWEEYYVWVHADTPKSFLKKKYDCNKKFILLTIPISLGLLTFYPAEYDLILLFVIGILFMGNDFG